MASIPYYLPREYWQPGCNEMDWFAGEVHALQERSDSDAPPQKRGHKCPWIPEEDMRLREAMHDVLWQQEAGFLLNEKNDLRSWADRDLSRAIDSLGPLIISGEDYHYPVALLVRQVAVIACDRKLA